MPQKLRKNRSTQGSKPTQTDTNMYSILTDDPPTKRSAKTTTDTATPIIPSQTPSDTQLKTIQNDIASMAHVIHALSNSIHKMDKLDKIDEIEARQKSSETMINEIVSDLRSELETIKTPNVNTPVLQTPSYAHITKPTQKKHKNNSDMTNKDIEDPEPDTNQDTSQNNQITAQNATIHTMEDRNDPDNIIPNAGYDTQQTFTPHPFIHPVPPTHQSSHQQWVDASKRWTDQSNNPTPYTSIKHGNVPQVPHYPRMDMNSNQQEDDQPKQGNISTHKCWKLAASETHQPHRFLQYMENIHLNGNSILHLHQFCERLRLAFHSSFSKPTDILPSFKDISPNYPFGHILIPQNEYYIGYHSIVNTYNWFSTALYVGLTDKKMISTRLAPLASRVIITDKTETDGWSLLYLPLCCCNSLLGGKGDDVIMEITTLRINQDKDIHKFYEQVTNLQEKLEFSIEIISKTKLLEKYLQAMTKLLPHHHLLQYFIIDLNCHITQQGHAHSHPTMSIHTIYQHLIATNAPINFQLKPTKKFRPNISQFTSEKNPHDTDTNLHETQDNEIENTISNKSHLSTYIL